MISYFDHTYSYLLQNDLDETLARFERAGFLRLKQKRRHPAGHLNGFVELTGGVLEFISVVDEPEFDREAEPDDRIFRKFPRPFNIGALTNDVGAIHASLSSHYPDMARPDSRGEANNPDGPILWSFCPISNEATPGARIFPLTYHAKHPDRAAYKVGANTIFAIGGFVFCTDAPARRLGKWRETLERLNQDVQSPAENMLSLGYQTLTWITPAEYQKRYCEAWVPQPSPNGEICAIRLLAHSNEIARDLLVNEGFRFASHLENGAVAFQRDKSTGYTFEVEERNPNIVLQVVSESWGFAPAPERH